MRGRVWFCRLVYFSNWDLGVLKLSVVWSGDSRLDCGGIDAAIEDYCGTR
jgi:hypothetical protein